MQRHKRAHRAKRAPAVNSAGYKLILITTFDGVCDMYCKLLMSRFTRQRSRAVGACGKVFG